MDSFTDGRESALCASRWPRFVLAGSVAVRSLVLVLVLVIDGSVHQCTPRAPPLTVQPSCGERHVGGCLSLAEGCLTLLTTCGAKLTIFGRASGADPKRKSAEAETSRGLFRSLLLVKRYNLLARRMVRLLTAGTSKKRKYPLDKPAALGGISLRRL
jgi:hypothetical protein